jgi:hypothetical protein
MNNHNSETKISRDGQASANSNDDLTDVSWAVEPPLNADGSPEKDYIKYILNQRCVRCGTAGGKAQRIVLDGWWCVPGQEASDAYMLPLCEKHDRELTRSRNKSSWWQTEGFRPVGEAVWLWDIYHATADRWMHSEKIKAERAKK